MLAPMKDLGSWLLRHWVLLLFMGSALYVHLRGRARFGLARALTDYTVLLAPLNALLYLGSAVRPRPYADPAQFPELAPLQAHWREIRDEALALDAQGRIRAAQGYNDLGFNSFFRTGWTRFYLSWYGRPLPSAQAACPRTLALLGAIPTIKGAMFASLPPGARLVRHRDPYAGSLRYHLGLVTPNSPECYIEVDGQRYHWRDGEAVMFDETFIHHAENRTQHARIVLFCDVERPLRFAPLAALNRWFARVVMQASATQNLPGEPVGAINRAFAQVYRVRLAAKRLKQRNRGVYYLGKWLLIGGVVVWLVV
jgi:beta-hydroxylase